MPIETNLVLGGGKERVNLVNFFYQVDSISIKGTYPGYKNEKPKKMRFDPPTLTLIFLKNFTSVGKFL